MFLDIYEALKNVLFSDSAVAGEAAGLAMGLINLGKANGKAIDEMLQYAHETQHEKIIRGLALGIALIMYGKEETADGLIEQLCLDKVRRICICIHFRLIINRNLLNTIGSHPQIFRNLYSSHGL